MSNSHVTRYYDQQAQQEWERLERRRTEFGVTLRALVEHLPPPPARVLDCGSGPGRYALELTRRGYEVTLFDLSSENLRLAQQKATAAGLTLAAYEQGTATDLARFADESFDAVLLLGPLYHLQEKAARLQALSQARRVLKPGKPLFAAFISRYALPRFKLTTGQPTWPLENSQFLDTFLATGVWPPPGDQDKEAFVAHYAHPTEIVPLCRGAGFEVKAVLGVEGIVSMIEDEVNALSGAAWQAWADLNYRLASDPSTHGCAGHLLAVAHKPRWRAVLRRIAQTLAEAGVAYKLGGGAAIVLHGVPLPVKDLDIGTNVEDAYRFQDLFADHVIEPVTLRESEVYRSHLGRFDFDGVLVEVMGDLQRREGSKWVPTEAVTETTLDLEGAPVRVSWLEEAVLAYIRRGRLERAALCLSHCDQGRMLALLRGEQAVGVL
jgi:ubiquinone/menaquinone biosynthesis C-methylase UbiE